MKKPLFHTLGALLIAAPLFGQLPPGLPPAADPLVSNGELKWFTLTETRAEVSKQFGLPTLANSLGSDFEVWQFQIGPIDDEGFSHQLVFRKSTGTLISITRNFASEKNVDHLLPEGESTTYFFPDDAGKPAYGVRVRKLPGGRLLIAQGVSKPGQLTSQILMIRESEVSQFFPWLARQMQLRTSSKR